MVAVGVVVVVAIKFHVVGLPVPQGSMNAVHHKSTGRIIMLQSAGKRLAAWRKAVAAEAARNSGDHLLEGAVSVEIVFHMKRPKKPKPTVAAFPVARPDIDKLIRAILDSLTSTVFVDDSQVCALFAHKRYCDTPGVWVEVSPL